MTYLRNALLVTGLAIALSACTSVKRTAVPVDNDTLVYSAAMADARQKQLLLNIVRLRYNDPVGFVDATDLQTSDSTERAAGLETAIGIDSGPFDEALGLSGGLTRSHSPEVAYTVLNGDTYAKQLLQPLPAESIFLLSQSGWSIERLMLCCVARIGHLDNARAAAGPTPAQLPDNRAFRELAEKLRAEQMRGNLLVQVFKTDGEEVVVMRWAGAPDLVAALRDPSIEQAVEVESPGRYRAVLSGFGNEVGDGAVRGRSLLGIMSVLSQTVNVPDEHGYMVQQTAGGSAAASGPCAAAGPWADVTGDFFAVQSSRSKPKSAHLAVQHRGYWFYIDDSCRSAKSTLDLVGHLYALQASLSGAGEGSRLLVF